METKKEDQVGLMNLKLPLDPLAHGILDARMLVERIHTINGAWHALRELWPATGETSPILTSMRLMKSTLQAQLLRTHHPLVYLQPDDSPHLPEPCYSLRLSRRIGGHRDACHLPLRIASMIFTVDELARFQHSEQL